MNGLLMRAESSVLFMAVVVAARCYRCKVVRHQRLGCAAAAPLTSQCVEAAAGGNRDADSPDEPMLRAWPRGKSPTSDAELPGNLAPHSLEARLDAVTNQLLNKSFQQIECITGPIGWSGVC